MSDLFYKSSNGLSVSGISRAFVLWYNKYMDFVNLYLGQSGPFIQITVCASLCTEFSFPMTGLVILIPNDKYFFFQFISSIPPTPSWNITYQMNPWLFQAYWMKPYLGQPPGTLYLKGHYFEDDL